MKYLDYEKAFSTARLNKYLKACNGDTTAALTLYRHNVKLSQKCYGILNIFEIVLRNAINEHYKAHFADPDWIRHQLVPGGMLENHPQRQSIFKIIADFDAAGKYTNDRVVSSVTLGFWTHLFSGTPGGCFVPKSHQLIVFWNTGGHSCSQIYNGRAVISRSGLREAQGKGLPRPVRG